MSIKLVTYVLNKPPGQKHVKVKEAIESSYPESIRLTESVYMVGSSSPLEAIFGDVKAVLDESDDLIVIEVGIGFNSWDRSSPEIHEWLRDAHAGLI